jgi:ligand-binding sensor domain-containing protein
MTLPASNPLFSAFLPAESMPAARRHGDGRRQATSERKEAPANATRAIEKPAGEGKKEVLMNVRVRFWAACVAAAGSLAAAAAADPWKSLAVESTPNLLSDEIQLLSPARDGSLFVGTLAGLARLKGDAVEKVCDAIGDPKKPQKPKVWAVREQADGTLWIGHERGLTRLKGGEDKNFLPALQVAPILEVKPGRLWAVGKQAGNPNAGLYQLAGEDWQRVPGSERYTIEDMALTAGGRVWVIVEGNGVLEVDPEAGFAAAVHHLQGITVTTVQEFAGQDGSPARVWAGTWSRGVAMWDGKDWVRHLDTLKESSILQIVRDTAGRTWVATSASGLFHAGPDLAEWQQELAAEGSINLLVADASGNVWISGQQTGGLRRHGPGGWSVSLDSPLPVQCLAQTADGRLVAGGVLDGIHILAKPPKGSP